MLATVMSRPSSNLVLGSSLIGLAPSLLLLADIALGNPLEQQRPLRPGLPRWMEDYRFLEDERKQTDPFDALRFHRLSESSWLQTGGEIRYRADSIEKPFFGLRGSNDDSVLMQRLQAHADVHLFDGGLRIFTQVQNTRAWGKDSPSPTDESRNDIQQAFMDGRFELGGSALTARFGRQEMAYGAQAFVTYRETPNVRQAFDGLRLSIEWTERTRLDAFAVRPVRIGTDAFDDGSNNQVKFYGLYGTLPLSSQWNMDLYAFGLETARRTLAGLTGPEQRYTFGTRVFGKSGALDWSWDLAGQSGTLAAGRIRAWGVSTDSGYNFSSAWRPRLGLRVDAASGDRQTGDKQVETFDPLFARNGVYGEAALITLSNVIIVGPVLGFSPWPAVRIEPGVFKAWKQSDADAVYLPGMAPVVSSNQGSGREIGTISKANVRWFASSNLTIDFDYAYYSVAEAIWSVGGEDSQFFSVRGSFRF